MKLRLIVNEHCLHQTELMHQIFVYDESSYDSFDMQFEKHCEKYELYVKLEVKSLKMRYQRFLENKNWYIAIIAESKMNTVNEHELENVQYN